MTCACCRTVGIFDSGCLRCLARYYVQALPREKLPLMDRWRSKYGEEAVSEIQRHVVELTTREKDRAA